MKPTVDQVLQALQNHRTPPRTPDARVRDAVQHVHVRLSRSPKTKPAALAEAIGLDNAYNVNVQAKLWHKTG